LRWSPERAGVGGIVFSSGHSSPDSGGTIAAPVILTTKYLGNRD
jgi:hypothetical protein